MVPRKKKRMKLQRGGEVRVGDVFFSLMSGTSGFWDRNVKGTIFFQYKHTGNTSHFSKAR